MKRVKIAVVLLAVLCGYSVLSLFILKFYNGRLIGHLDNIKQAYDSGDESRAVSAADELNGYWHKYEKAVTMIIHDGQLSELNISISKLKPMIEAKDHGFDAELESSYHQLEYIFEEECPYWYNIL